MEQPSRKLKSVRSLFWAADGHRLTMYVNAYLNVRYWVVLVLLTSKFPHRPDVVGQARFHGGSDPQGQVRAAEIVPGDVQEHGCLEVVQGLGNATGLAGKPPQGAYGRSGWPARCGWWRYGRSRGYRSEHGERWL